MHTRLRRAAPQGSGCRDSGFRRKAHRVNRIGREPAAAKTGGSRLDLSHPILMLLHHRVGRSRVAAVAPVRALPPAGFFRGSIEPAIRSK